MQLVYNNTVEYSVFVSSGEDALHLRDLVDDLVNNAVNSELDIAGLPVRLIVRWWERTAPGRADDESVNARFVRMATSSSVTICLRLAKLGGGTREEIEAVLEADGVELAIVWSGDSRCDRLGRARPKARQSCGTRSSACVRGASLARGARRW